VGELIEERRGGKTSDVVRRQVESGLARVAADQTARLVIAYEPVWAIGTGENATPAQAQEVHALVRRLLAARFGESVSQTVRIQYGGSVTPDNARDLMGQPDVDGALVGGASLDADRFARIVQAAAAAKSR
jgi:triosephosphate isomerase